ncbi:DegV family protein [Demequina sp.]|uniref:DegV family protein n=1 Tax=Demequina sp. TaxID=2050685 RepID=UPI0025EB855C|nr:DegV family protein [Demequina sp.]
MTVAVIVDSAASLPPALAQRWGVRVVPLQVIVDAASYDEGVGIDADTVLARLTEGAAVTTSQPTPGAFDAAIADAVAAGADAVVIVTISGRLSGTAEVARIAATQAAVPVEVVDSRTLAMAEGFAAIAAADAARAGRGLAEVAAAARETAARSRCVFTVDTLEFLRRGGRITPAVATAGKILGIRPVLEIVDGEVTLAARVRSTARARAALLAMVDDALAGCEHPAVSVMSVGEPSVGDDAALAIEARFPGAGSVVRTPVSAVLAVHTGPGTLAAVVVDLPRALG